MRRDMVTLLTYVRDERVVGTKSTGNMPLKHIREVTARFVEPPELDQRIGDHVYPLRTEFEVRPLYYLHVLAEVGDLLEAPAGRRWHLTPVGEDWLSASPLEQTLQLLLRWWFRVNWLVVVPFGGLDEFTPPGFELTTLARLNMIPVGQRIEFESFAERLCKRTGLKWDVDAPTITPESRATTLRAAVKLMVIDPAAKFGIVELEERPLGPGLRPKLLAFRITPLGRALLSGIQLFARST